MRAPADGFHLRRIQLSQSRLGQDLRTGAEVPLAISIEQQAAIGESHGKIYVVQAGDNAGARIGRTAKHVQSVELVLGIQVIGRKGWKRPVKGGYAFTFAVIVQIFPTSALW